MTLWELNRITPSAFATALGDIFEHSPWVAERASTARPFGSIAALHAAMLDVVDAAPTEMRLALIRAHPELAGKAAIRGELTADSTMEQSGAGLSQCSADELVAPDGAQRGLQREIRLPVHPRGQGLRSRRASCTNSSGASNATWRPSSTRRWQQIARITRFRLDALLSE